MRRDATASALAQDLLTRLYAAGLRHVVLAPGSRSAPFAFALHGAELRRDLSVHVRIDERSAGFLALGLAIGSRAPVAVVTTSGTAVGNLLPAVMEASHTGRRLVLITADRPERLRGTGANQTTHQVDIFGRFAECHDLPHGADPHASDAAVGAAVEAVTRAAGPVHLNVQLGAPLMPDDPDPDTWWRLPAGIHRAESVTARTRDAPATRPAPKADPLRRGPRTVVVAGDDSGPAARLLAEAGNWPLLAEPTSGARVGRQAIRTYRLLLGTTLRNDIERVVVVGHPTLSRPVTELISDAGLEVLSVRGADGVATDPGRVARHLEAVPSPAEAGSDGRREDEEWFQRWRAADDDLSSRIDAELASRSDRSAAASPLAVAAIVGGAVGPHTTLVVGSSNPVRDLDVMAEPWPPHEHRFVVGNRGLAGIDGLVSTAVGVALGRAEAARTIAYLGDLTFLHDTNGLLIPTGEPRPPVTFVVLNDDGGAIFAGLEQGHRDYAPAFERVFGTPHGTDLAALCGAHHIRHERITDLGRLAEALTEQPDGIRVLEVPVSRQHRRAEAARLRTLAEQVVPDGAPSGARTRGSATGSL